MIFPQYGMLMSIRSPCKEMCVGCWRQLLAAIQADCWLTTLSPSLPSLIARVFSVALSLWYSIHTRTCTLHIRCTCRLATGAYFTCTADVNSASWAALGSTHTPFAMGSTALLCNLITPPRSASVASRAKYVHCMHLFLLTQASQLPLHCLLISFPPSFPPSSLVMLECTPLSACHS